MVPLFYNTRSLWARRLSTGLTVVGLGLVVFVFSAVLMLANGIESALASGGDASNVVVLRKGATSELVSGVERDAVRILTTDPQVASGPDGMPLVAGERVVLLTLPSGRTQAMNTSARGISAESFAARPEVQLVSGRRPLPGTNEVVLGRSLVGTSPEAALGGELRFARQRWPVVGVFAARGGAFESEVWADAMRLGTAFGRDDYSSAVVRLRSPAEVDAFVKRVEANPRFTLEARPEPAYWADQASGLAAFIRVLGLFVSFVFSVGAVLGAMITMYAQVATRVAELGMLRAVGFRRRSVLASVVVESAMLGAAGGVLGALGALATRWIHIRTLNFQTFAAVSFGFSPTPAILLGALLFGTGMGLLGGLLPALRAARLSILDALRA
ncbi:ABC-type transporter2C permease component [Corallococcus coralloides DSM 2259]|uniref:ABC-type transporter2C permease component n=1 Tax=Corallococcus coralloides (strain ATCC 25202 / DSM 2259 / NBRC 100086 / M2) TaxID=1144275 RepID=H8N201_CORCM|nr:FtsX-like permease family protein [Corallococcus coralloides]AFE09303.1 ABC-type transporter2C permease component [Corallococcus coralloides DSM 2259]